MVKFIKIPVNGKALPSKRKVESILKKNNIDFWTVVTQKKLKKVM